MYLAHRVSSARTQTAFVVVRKKLSLVNRHIHLHRTLAFAAFARETQIQRFFDFFTLPTIGNRFAANHFAQQTRAPTRRVFLFECHHITWTHRSTFVLTTDAGANTTFGCRRETLMIVRKSKLRVDLWWIPVRPEAQIFVNTIWIDQLAGIHFPFRIPD